MSTYFFRPTTPGVCAICGKPYPALITRMHLSAKGIVHPTCDEEEPMGMLTRTFLCTECFAPAKLTVHADGPEDPRVMDRFRLLACSQGWVIDFAGRPWCGEHRPDKENKPKRRKGDPRGIPEGEPERKDRPPAPERMVPTRPRPARQPGGVRSRPKAEPRPESERVGSRVCRSCWTIHPPEAACR